MASSCLEDVELGFAEKPEDPNKLSSPYFPSKIGGKPAWLDPVNLPQPEDLVCKKCNKPLVFLLQVYAPIDHLSHCYHRTLYLFCCREPLCHSQNSTDPFLVLRCNLPQANSFYHNKSCEVTNGAVTTINNSGQESTKDDIRSISDSNITSSTCSSVQNCSIQDDFEVKPFTDSRRSSDDTVIHEDSHTTVSNHKMEELPVSEHLKLNLKLPPLCSVCGCSGPKKCAKCHSVNYCSREHQVIHWKAGHKKQCGDDEKRSTTTDVLASTILFEEFEIVTESEPQIIDTPERSEEERLKDYHKFLEQHSEKSDSMDKICLDEVEKGLKNDKQFMMFKKRIEVEPDQVHMQ